MTVAADGDARSAAARAVDVFDIRDFGMEPPRILMFKVAARRDGDASRSSPRRRSELTCASASPARWSSCSRATSTSLASTSAASGGSINIGLLEDEHLAPGDWVLIHVGFAMSKIDEAEAAMALASLQMMGGVYTDEVDALDASSVVTPERRGC